MSAPLRVALVGAGAIGRGAHLPALLGHPDVELAAIVEPDPRARSLAKEVLAAHGAAMVTFVEDPDGLDAVDRLDAWVVATPPWVTPALARRGLEQGRFVLAEKPIATTTAMAAQQLGGLAPELTARLQVGFSYRHDPAIERLRELIASGALGAPLLVRATIYDELDDPADREHAARMRATLAHGLPVVHEGAHVADWLRVLLGPAMLEVEQTWSLRTQAQLPADNVCGASLRHPDGHRVQVEIGWLLPAPAPSVITVRGAGGCAELDVMTLHLRVATRHAVAEEIGVGDRNARCFARQLDRFVALCRGDAARTGAAAGAPTLADALAGLALTERIALRMEASA